MTGRTSLIEQKRLQWAQEREEMARLSGNWGALKYSNPIRTTIRTYPSGTRVSLSDKERPTDQPLRATGQYGSAISLRSFGTETSGNCASNLKTLDFTGGSLIDLHNQTDVSQMRKRSPSLPPIYNKEQQSCFPQIHKKQTGRKTLSHAKAYKPDSFALKEQQGDIELQDSQYHSHKQQKQQHYYQQYRQNNRHEKDQLRNYGSPVEERGGETSGYASDSVEVPQSTNLSTFPDLLPGCKPPGEMNEKTWQNPYYSTPESSLPPSRMLSATKIGELNRPRWGSVWNQDAIKGDPPPPSWLARLGQSSQVLVINHDSASSPDSSTTGSAGSDPSKTYIRGQNIPIDADILQEREARRQKAIELQNAIKQQLEEKDRQRREEKERRMREERLEEERIKREREKEKERFEEEQRRLKEKEEAKLKQAAVMREVLEAAERLAKEDKKIRRRPTIEEKSTNDYVKETEIVGPEETTESSSNARKIQDDQHVSDKEENMKNSNEEKKMGSEKVHENMSNKSNDVQLDGNTLKLPISKDVAIVLSGRLEDPEILNRANLQLVNLVVTPSSKNQDYTPRSIATGLNGFAGHVGSPILTNAPVRLSPRIVENRLLTPSKYRLPNGRDFGTQTDLEDDLRDIRERIQLSSLKDGSNKERKDNANASRRDVDKSVNAAPGEEMGLKSYPRSKCQARTSLESRPRWNANRPGTRYRTQSEKDPHYQRRLRLRRRQVETSDDGSRSPSPHRRKHSNAKSKARNSSKRKVKTDSYDADLSMDSLNSVVPLRVDKNGMINIEAPKEQRDKARFDDNRENEATRLDKSEKENSNIWCGQEILSKLNSLRNDLLMQQVEWESERCLLSPPASEIF